MKKASVLEQDLIKYKYQVKDDKFPKKRWHWLN